MRQGFRFATSFALCAVAACALGTALAQSYPNRPLRIVVPFSAGGANDSVARFVRQKLGEAFGQPVLVANRRGGATNVGTEIVAKAAPDGCTLLLNNSSLVTNASVYASLPCDFRKDFAPAAGGGNT